MNHETTMNKDVISTFEDVKHYVTDVSFFLRIPKKFENLIYWDINFAISADVILLVPGVHQEDIKNLSRNMHQQNACPFKFRWSLNQPGIQGFSIKHK